MKTFRQNYHLQVEPASYVIDLLDTCFDGAETFFDLGCGNPKKYFLHHKYERNFMTRREVLSIFITGGFKVTKSTRGSIAPRLTKLFDQATRALIPFPVFYDTAYFILEMDN